MNGMIAGTIAGAAGTIALDVTTYADMALRGRAPSEMPSEVVRLFAERLGLRALATPSDRADEATKNRRSALGALLGYGVGVKIGAVYGCLRPLPSRLPLGVAGIILGGLAMAASDVPAVKLGATNLAEWDAASWLSDVVPHLIYGFVTASVARALLPLE